MLELPEDHMIMSLRRRTPIVRQPDGELLRLRTSGDLVTVAPVESVQSYLDVHE